MPWFKVDDNLDFHPKVIAAGNSAMGLWVRAGAYCAKQLTDGFVPRQMLNALGGRQRDVSQLVNAGLWVPGSATDQPENGQTLATDQPENGQAPDSDSASRGRKDRTKVEGWWFRNWEDFQPTKAQVEADRRATAERVKAWRKRKSNGVSNDVGNGVTNDVTNGVSNTAPSRPVPSRPEETKVSSPQKKPETPLPKDWMPNQSHAERAEELDIDLMDAV